MIVRSSTPKATSTMVFGRKKEASDEAEPWDARQPAAAAGGRPVPAADRRRVGHRGQHLHQRRLHQLARREVRQGRRLGEVARRAGQRQARPAEHAAHHRQRRQGKHLRRRPRQPPHPGVRSGDGKFMREIKIDVPVPPDAHSRAMGATPRTPNERPAARWRRAPRGRSASRRERRTQYLYSSDAFPGRVYKLSLDGKVLGRLGKAGKQPKTVRLDSRDRLPVGERDCTSAELLNWRVQKLLLGGKGAGTRD